MDEENNEVLYARGRKGNSMARNRSERGSKVERVGEKYGLSELTDDLVDMWSGPEQNMSVRELSELFNVRILEAAMRDAGNDPLEGDAENIYRLLTDDDVTRGTKVETETRLSRQGVDIEELQGDFVSHQTVYRYLTESRGATHSRRENSREKVIDTVNRLRGRLVTVAESNLDSLRNANKLTLGPFSVVAEISVFCEDCASRYEITELLRRGGCDCEA